MPLLTTPCCNIDSGFPAGNPPIIPVSKEQARDTASLIDEIQREFKGAAEGPDRIVRLLLQLILMKMNRFYLPGNVTNSSRREAELVRHFLVNLEQNPKVATSVSAHAALLCVSPETLSETVKKETGKTPGTLIRERVLLEAKRLLLHTSLSVAEIAYQLLFKDRPISIGSFDVPREVHRRNFGNNVGMPRSIDRDELPLIPACCKKRVIGYDRGG